MNHIQNIFFLKYVLLILCISFFWLFLEKIFFPYEKFLSLFSYQLYSMSSTTFRHVSIFKVAISPEFGVFQWDFSCLFLNKKSACPKFVRELKRTISLDDRVPKISQFQYGNTPSCEEIDFGPRYWGSHYPRLLRIKKIWDPTNVFNHCHSVGSTDQHCCPY